MDEYNGDMTELKSLVSDVLEKEGTLAKIKAELRASIFQAVEQHDRAGDPGGEKAVLGTCSSMAKALHNTRNGQVLTSLLQEYMEWAELDHTSRVFTSEANLAGPRINRSRLEDLLNLPASQGKTRKPDRPLLLDLLDLCLSNKVSTPAKPSPVGGSTNTVVTPRGASPSSRFPRSASPGSRRVESASPSLTGLRRAESQSPVAARSLSPAGRQRPLSPAPSRK